MLRRKGHSIKLDTLNSEFRGAPDAALGTSHICEDGRLDVLSGFHFLGADTRVCIRPSAFAATPPLGARLFVPDQLSLSDHASMVPRVVGTLPLLSGGPIN
jgi:hypothetical protein